MERLRLSSRLRIDASDWHECRRWRRRAGLLEQTVVEIRAQEALVRVLREQRQQQLFCYCALPWTILHVAQNIACVCTVLVQYEYVHVQYVCRSVCVCIIASHLLHEALDALLRLLERVPRGRRERRNRLDPRLRVQIHLRSHTLCTQANLQYKPRGLTSERSRHGMSQIGM